MYAETLLDIAMIHSDSLIEQARKGDNRAIGKLVNLWYKRIYNFCLRYLGDHDYAMDAAQNTFIAMNGSVSRLSAVQSFKPWLYRIALNQCHDHLRKKKRNLIVSYRSTDDEEEYSPMENVRDTQRDPHEKLHLADLNEILEYSLGELSDEQREVIIMKEYEGLKFREIAEALHVSENTVKSRLYYALNHMRKSLKERSISKEILYYE